MKKIFSRLSLVGCAIACFGVATATTTRARLPSACISSGMIRGAVRVYCGAGAELKDFKAERIRGEDSKVKLGAFAFYCCKGGGQKSSNSCSPVAWARDGSGFFKC